MLLHYEIYYDDDLNLKKNINHNSPSSCPSNKDKPWLLVIHPLFLDLTWLTTITSDLDYLQRFNIIVFDQRHHGRSLSTTFSPSCDHNTLAADLAFALQSLNLPPVHVLATQAWASDIAISLAAIFPEKVSSLFLCGLAPDQKSQATKEALDECFKCLTVPENIDDWDEGIGALHYFFFGGLPDDGKLALVIDQWTGSILRRYPPSKAQRAAAVCLPDMIRQADPTGLKESIVAPVLILHGKNSTVSSSAQAAQRFSGYINVGEGSKLKLIDDAPLFFLPTHADMIKQEYFSWIEPRLSHPITISQQAPNSSYSSFPKSLATLARIFKDPEIAQRDPFLSESFHAIPSVELPGLKALLESLESRQTKSFSLYGGGAPESWTDASLEEKLPWRFSERFELARNCQRRDSQILGRF